MNIRSLAAKGLLCAAIAVGTLPITAVHAFATGSDNHGCGAGFTESTVSELAAYAADKYQAEDPNVADWTAVFNGVDANDDGSVCWHPIGKTCPCGANAINVVDDNANATFE